MPLIIIANIISDRVRAESGAYVAYTWEDEPEQIHEYGNSPEEALGKLILNHKDRFSLLLIRQLENK